MVFILDCSLRAGIVKVLNVDIDEKLHLITRNLVEIVTLDELREKLETGEKLKGYIGYEPSGLVHVGWLVWMMKVKDLIDAGIDFTILEATWHAHINDKLGGDLTRIHQATRLVRAVLEGLGISSDKVRFIDADELVSDKDYWAMVIKVSKNTSLARMKRALTIMGRKADEAELDSSKLIYPAMQVSDIFYMNLDIALGGLDQRKAHMLARDVARKVGAKKPIALHTPLITGLKGGKRMEANIEIDDVMAQIKMSKSDPANTILVHDSPEDIARKIRKAYCPAGVEEFNPILEINKYILFSRPGFRLVVERPAKYGGTVEYESYEQLREDFINGRLHPLDLKNATAKALSELLEPVRKRLLGDPEIRQIIEELEKIQGLK